MTKNIKKVGLWTFIAGFMVFVFTLSLSDYQLTPEIIEEQGNGEKFEALQQASQRMMGKNYDTNFSFISNLRASFEQANQAIIDKYALPENLAEDIASKAHSGEQYNFRGSLIDEVITGDDEISKYQKANLSEYTGWLEDRSFDSGENLTRQLKNAIKSYNNSLSYQKAFDSYTTDNLVFWITKNASLGILTGNLKLWFLFSFGLMLLGAFTYFYGNYKNTQPGIKNNDIYHDPMTNIGWLGIVTGIFLIAFYVVLYFYPEYLTNWVLLVDPVSKWLNGGPASHWFLYGFMYTLAILVMGVRMLLKYRHSKHQIWRTISVMFFQTAFAFIIPEILAALNKPSYDFKNIWPLDYDFFYSYNLNELMASGLLGWFMLFWGIALIIVAVPVITYFYGKRWYCSWVCGCGGLAETLGDPYRHLSDKSLKAWKIERWMVHGVLVFAVINTGAVLYTFFSGSYSIFGLGTESIKASYGFLISSIFAGVVGVGFYPFMGNRVWCRFGCPLAAYLGIVQRFKSRFRITTNGGQCISCGNCSVYCEMGIDVRWYAQRGQNIVRASCVGCGICSAVCPRGVLRLENGPEKDRMGIQNLVGNNAKIKTI